MVRELFIKDVVYEGLVMILTTGRGSSLKIQGVMGDGNWGRAVGVLFLLCFLLLVAL
jgi:hypothetical protein